MACGRGHRSNPFSSIVGVAWRAARSAAQMASSQDTATAAALGELGIGDAAPPLTVTKWVKGEPVAANDAKKA
mgnify:CR=1 FL=1